MPPQTKMKVSALPAEKEEKKPTLAVVGSKIPAELSQQLRKLAHDLSNSMETVMQASYLLAQAKTDANGKKWARMIETAAQDAARVNREMRTILKSQS